MEDQRLLLENGESEQNSAFHDRILIDNKIQGVTNGAGKGSDETKVNIHARLKDVRGQNIR